MENPTSLPQPQQNPSPSNPNPRMAASQPLGKKRRPENGDFRNSSYFKIRSIIKDLRPFFLEVIHAPDFRDSKAALEIKKRMKIMMEMSKQLSVEAASISPEKPPLAVSKKEGELGKHQEGGGQVPQPQTGSSADQSEKVDQPEKNLKTTSEEKISELNETGKLLDEGLQGTPVIGGSPIGWNFLVYPGSKSVYSGVTKAVFLSRQVAK